MPGRLWLEWERAAKGYRICEPEPYFFETQEDREVDDESFFLAPKDDEIVTYRPMDQFPGLFMEFAHTEQTLDGLKGFADKFGLLQRTPNLRAEYGMKIFEWRLEVRQMRRATNMWAEERKGGSIARLIKIFSERAIAGTGVFLRAVEDPMRAEVYIKPSNLQEAMWMQLVTAIANNSQLRRCAQCPSWIVYGSGTGRRESAKFCSSACRRAAWKAGKESSK